MAYSILIAAGSIYMPSTGYVNPPPEYGPPPYVCHLPNNPRELKFKNVKWSVENFFEVIGTLGLCKRFAISGRHDTTNFAHRLYKRSCSRTTHLWTQTELAEAKIPQGPNALDI